ncbi:TetR-like C-terminal domain-containing protein [Streptomyces sp. NPDC020766]|uniref:TetR-like C-terminal domain-containing protein n=1 Tax=Streptomyces sp. NPDC020766 TaxID=3155011 RepID=UPI0033C62D8E
MTAALLRYSGSVELEDTGDLRHDLVDYLVALADLLFTTTGRAMQRAIQSARENLEVALPVNRIFEQRVARLQQVVDHAVARGELPPVDGYFLAEILTGPVHLYVSRGLHPFTTEAERVTDVVLAGLRHTAG